MYLQMTCRLKFHFLYKITWVFVLRFVSLVIISFSHLISLSTCYVDNALVDRWLIASQISSSLPKKAFASWQHDFFPLASRFTRACAGIKTLIEVKVTYVFRLFIFLFFFVAAVLFFGHSFFSFSYLFAAVFDLLVDSLSSWKNSQKASSRRAIFTLELPRAVAGNFALSFSLKFLSIFVHISSSTELITLIWVSLENLFLQQKLSIAYATFNQR